jgi:hypothetical protein
VRPVPFGHGASATVVSGTGSDAQVVWIVQQGRTVAVIQVPAGDTAPPDSVNVGVAKLLDVSLETWSTQGTGETVSGATKPLPTAKASAILPKKAKR